MTACVAGKEAVPLCSPGSALRPVARSRLGGCMHLGRGVPAAWRCAGSKARGGASRMRDACMHGLLQWTRVDRQPHARDMLASHRMHGPLRSLNLRRRGTAAAAGSGQTLSMVVGPAAARPVRLRHGVHSADGAALVAAAAAAMAPVEQDSRGSVATGVRSSGSGGERMHSRHERGDVLEKRLSHAAQKSCMEERCAGLRCSSASTGFLNTPRRFRTAGRLRRRCPSHGSSCSASSCAMTCTHRSRCCRPCQRGLSCTSVTTEFLASVPARRRPVTAAPQQGTPQQAHCRSLSCFPGGARFAALM